MLDTPEAKTTPEDKRPGRPRNAEWVGVEGKDSTEVYLREGIVDKLKEDLDKRSFTPEGRGVEAAGALIGHFRTDPESGDTWIDAVDYVGIPEDLTPRSGIHVTFTHDSWGYVQEKIDGLTLEHQQQERYSMVGWVHSHPGLGVFLSSQDDLVNRTFLEDRVMAVVYDPSIEDQHKSLGIMSRGGSAEERDFGRNVTFGNNFRRHKGHFDYSPDTVDVQIIGEPNSDISSQVRILPDIEEVEVDIQVEPEVSENVNMKGGELVRFISPDGKGEMRYLFTWDEGGKVRGDRIDDQGATIEGPLSFRAKGKIENADEWEAIREAQVGVMKNLGGEWGVDRNLPTPGKSEKNQYEPLPDNERLGAIDNFLKDSVEQRSIITHEPDSGQQFLMVYSWDGKGNIRVYAESYLEGGPSEAYAYTSHFKASTKEEFNEVVKRQFESVSSVDGIEVEPERPTLESLSTHYSNEAEEDDVEEQTDQGVKSDPTLETIRESDDEQSNTKDAENQARLLTTEYILTDNSGSKIKYRFSVKQTGGRKVLSGKAVNSKGEEVHTYIDYGKVLREGEDWHKVAQNILKEFKDGDGINYEEIPFEEHDLLEGIRTAQSKANTSLIEIEKAKDDPNLPSNIYERAFPIEVDSYENKLEKYNEYLAKSQTFVEVGSDDEKYKNDYKEWHQRLEHSQYELSKITDKEEKLKKLHEYKDALSQFGVEIRNVRQTLINTEREALREKELKEHEKSKAKRKIRSKRKHKGRDKKSKSRRAESDIAKRMQEALPKEPGIQTSEFQLKPELAEPPTSEQAPKLSEATLEIEEEPQPKTEEKPSLEKFRVEGDSVKKTMGAPLSLGQVDLFEGPREESLELIENLPPEEQRIIKGIFIDRKNAEQLNIKGDPDKTIRLILGKLSRMKFGYDITRKPEKPKEFKPQPEIPESTEVELTGEDAIEVVARELKSKGELAGTLGESALNKVFENVVRSQVSQADGIENVSVDDIKIENDTARVSATINIKKGRVNGSVTINIQLGNSDNNDGELALKNLGVDQSGRGMGTLVRSLRVKKKISDALVLPSDSLVMGLNSQLEDENAKVDDMGLHIKNNKLHFSARGGELK